MSKAADARARRKAMLRDRLEPVFRTMVRQPWDGSTAKTGRVTFRDDADRPLLSLVVMRDDDGALVVETRGRVVVRHVHVTGGEDDATR